MAGDLPAAPAQAICGLAAPLPNRVPLPFSGCSRPPVRCQGYAYVEFLEVDAVQNAVLLDNSDLRGRQLKVRGVGLSPVGLGHLFIALGSGMRCRPIRTPGVHGPKFRLSQQLVETPRQAIP